MTSTGASWTGSDMQIPVVFECDDILFFRSLEDAALYLEPQDVQEYVQNHKNIAYDVTGRSISLTVRNGRTVADYIEDAPSQAQEVERLLREDIRPIDPDIDLRSLSLNDLVELRSQWQADGEYCPSRLSIWLSNLPERFASSISKLFTGRKPPKD